MPNNDYYQSQQHREWRERVLRKGKYLCEECKKYGKLVAATHAHHIIPISADPSKALKLENGMALCTACHNKLEPREKGVKKWR